MPGFFAAVFLLACTAIFAEDFVVPPEQMPGVDFAERIDALLVSSTDNMGKDSGKAIQYAKEALFIAREYDSLEGEFLALVVLGEAYQSTGLSDTALGYFYQAIRKHKDAFGQVALGQLYNAIGSPLAALKGQDQALGYYQRAIDIGQETGDKGIVATAKLNAGKIYAEQGRMEKAQSSYAEAASMLLDLGQDVEYAQAIYSMGYIDLSHDKIELALKKFAEVLRVSELLDNRRLQTLAYLGRGDARTRMHAEKLAEADLLKGLKLSRTSGFRDLSSRSHELLSTLYKQLQRYQDALLHSEKWMLLERQQLNSEIVEHITSLRSLSELDEQRKQILTLEKDAQIQTLRLKRGQLVNQISIIGVLLLVLVVMIVLGQYRTKNRMTRQLLVLNEELTRQATTDPLTGLLNRRAMLALLDKEVKRFERKNETFIVAIGDIDHFKQVNDRYGHGCGDVVLNGVARQMAQQLREVDAICRWGGEEFLLLFSGTDLHGGEVAANKIRLAVARHSETCAKSKIQVTITLGYCIYDGENDILECLKLADEALYAGKAAGRNLAMRAVRSG